MTAKLLLTLGPGLEPGPYCSLLVLDWETKEVVDQFQYTHRVYEQSHKGFAGACWSGNRLLVTTEVELLEFEVNPLRLVGTHTFPFLNDVHHVGASADRIWVCNTGLDCVEELDTNCQPLATHFLTTHFGRKPRQVASLFRDDLRKSLKRLRGDYEYYTHLTKRPPFRNVAKLLWRDAYRRNGHDLRFSDFRPHFLHPNHVLPVGDDLWITLWRTGEIVSLKTGKTLISGLGRPHDGVIVDDELYATDCRSNRLIMHHIDRPAGMIGPRTSVWKVTETTAERFLREVAVTENRVFAGLTARRSAPPKFRSARVVALQRGSLARVEEWIVPEEFGLQVFSILDVQECYA